MLIGGAFSEQLNRVLRHQARPDRMLVQIVGESLQLIYERMLREPPPEKLVRCARLVPEPRPFGRGRGGLRSMRPAQKRSKRSGSR
jgi:hypothetical protein